MPHLDIGSSDPRPSLASFDRRWHLDLVHISIHLLSQKEKAQLVWNCLMVIEQYPDPSVLADPAEEWKGYPLVLESPLPRVCSSRHPDRRHSRCCRLASAKKLAISFRLPRWRQRRFWIVECPPRQSQCHLCNRRLPDLFGAIRTHISRWIYTGEYCLGSFYWEFDGMSHLFALFQRNCEIYELRPIFSICPEEERLEYIRR